MPKGTFFLFTGEVAPLRLIASSSHVYVWVLINAALERKKFVFYPPTIRAV